MYTTCPDAQDALTALDQPKTTEQQVRPSRRGWQCCTYLCHEGLPDFLFQECHLPSPTLVRIPDKPVMGFEGGTFDSVHRTMTHAARHDAEW